MDKLETRTAFIWLLEPNIVWEDLKQDVEIDASDIHDNITASLILTKGARHSAILDARGKDATLTNKAMKYGASKEVTKHRIATAHITASLSGRLIGNFFMKFFKPAINNRLFSDDKEAVIWLSAFSK